MQYPFPPEMKLAAFGNLNGQKNRKSYFTLSVDNVDPKESENEEHIIFIQLDSIVWQRLRGGSGRYRTSDFQHADL